ncbi:type II toxin-antitoxin system VapC family toxin [Thermococcus sp. Bubb.Bath]|uniref:type II toxin-antitoxin system VapC family toxin n=1 Tax=Thermococcus sp. Bubb.Bath TaxID=1638242 RepID=UPI00143A5C17|nr:type II toxin-antitoxin system VapC family toxin [Thermococcus sp. Bubb.Bath]NJF25030.1 PIN domain-containing protein [Thermococcus sp. Bubb.Bath]
MIVIDANVLIDALLERNPERRNLAIEFFNIIEGKPVYVPRIFIVEVLSIARRLGIELDHQTLLPLIEEFNVKSEGELFNLAVYVAENIHPKAVDAYYIATAILTGSILMSNDRIMVQNSRRAGINAFYLLMEVEELKQFLNHR